MKFSLLRWCGGLLPGLGLGLLGCAPGASDVQVRGSSSVEDTVAARFLENSCIKVADRVSCSTATSEQACAVSKGTEVSIAGLRAPYGFRVGDKDHVLASSVSIVSVSSDGQSQGKLRSCDDAALDRLARAAADQESDPALKRHSLRLWAPHLALKQNRFIPTIEATEVSFIFPATGWFTSPFGWRWGKMHRGIDIANPSGPPLLAAADGQVVLNKWLDGYGNGMALQHSAGRYETLYAHMPRPSALSIGARVSQGDVIGTMGSTGRSTGVHTHFEICDVECRAGNQVDPLSKINPFSERSPIIKNLNEVLQYFVRLGRNVLGPVLERIRSGFFRSDAGDQHSEDTAVKPPNLGTHAYEEL